MTKRTGRKRKSGARQPNGQVRREIRYPGAEVLRARLAAAGIAVPTHDEPGREERLRDLAVLHGVASASAVAPLDLLAGLGRLHRPGEDPKLSQIRADKGAELAALHWRLFGAPVARGQDYGYVSPPSIDDGASGRGRRSTARGPALPSPERDAYQEALYEAMRAALKACGRRAYDAVLNAAVYGRRPTDPWRNPTRAASEREDLMVGLQALIDMAPVARPKREAVA